MKKIVIWAAILFFPCAVHAQDHGCISLAVNALPGGEFTSTISAQSSTDILLWVLFNPGAVNRFSGDHEVEFRITTPHGFLYESRTIPLTADKNMDGEEKPIVDYPFPVPYHILEDLQFGNDHFLAVNIDLPLAGSPVTLYSLYGQWTAEAVVDDEPVPCSKPLTFTITP
jgi:hypothetical protein